MIKGSKKYKSSSNQFDYLCASFLSDSDRENYREKTKEHNNKQTKRRNIERINQLIIKIEEGCDVCFGSNLVSEKEYMKISS